ncbi:MAG: alanine--glyoxylate aminotransferase family protein [Candidatus Baltobacteraceae bacterium]
MERQRLFLPGPVAVAQPVLDALSRPLVNHRGPEFAQMLKRITDALRPVYGTTGEVVLLGSSGTGGLEAALVNLFSPGELLLSCALGAFGRRFAAIAKSYGCVVEQLDPPLGAAVDPRALQARLERDTERRIAGVLLTQNETSTGVQSEMAALAPALRAHGAIVLVDAISGLGAAEYRMDEWGHDAVVTASQKAFGAVPGVAMVALSDRAWKRAEQAKTPRFYFDFKRARDAAAAGQTPWTPPISVLYALDVALTRYHEEGLTAAYARHARHAQIVRDGLLELGFTLVSQPGAHSCTVVAAYPPQGIEPAALLDRLREQHGIVLADGQGELAGKIVRFGTMGAIDESDIRSALDAIGEEVRVTSGAA